MTRQEKGEKIGGGWFVFRRGKKTGRIGVRFNTLPFEHPTAEAARTEAERLAQNHPGETYHVFNDTGVSARCEPEDTQ